MTNNTTLTYSVEITTMLTKGEIMNTETKTIVDVLIDMLMDDYDISHRLPRGFRATRKESPEIFVIVSVVQRGRSYSYHGKEVVRVEFVGQARASRRWFKWKSGEYKAMKIKLVDLVSEAMLTLEWRLKQEIKNKEWSDKRDAIRDGHIEAVKINVESWVTEPYDPPHRMKFGINADHKITIRGTNDDDDRVYEMELKNLTLAQIRQISKIVEQGEEA